MTSRPLHVRLEIAVDAEHPERCSTVCVRLNMDRKPGLATCIEFGALKWNESYPPMRHAACSKATTADALNAAVVEAAKNLRHSYPAGAKPVNKLVGMTQALIDAVDALRSAKQKETP